MLQPAGGSKGARRTAAMDGGGGFNAPSDQNPHRGRQPERWIRLPGLPLRTGPSLATPEEPGQVAGSDSPKDPQARPPSAKPDGGGRQSHAQGLVWLLQASRKEQIPYARP